MLVNGGVDNTKEKRLQYKRHQKERLNLWDDETFRRIDRGGYEKGGENDRL